MAKYRFFHYVTAPGTTQHKMYQYISQPDGTLHFTNDPGRAAIHDIADPEVMLPRIRQNFEATFDFSLTCWQDQPVENISTYYELAEALQDFDFQQRTINGHVFEGSPDLRCWWTRGRSFDYDNRVLVFPPPIIRQSHVGWLVAIAEPRYSQEFTGINAEVDAFLNALKWVKQKTS